MHRMNQLHENGPARDPDGLISPHLSPPVGDEGRRPAHRTGRRRNATLFFLAGLVACDGGAGGGEVDEDRGIGDGQAAREMGASTDSDVPVDRGAGGIGGGGDGALGGADASPADAGPVPDIGPYDPYEATGVFTNVPTEPCLDVQVPAEDLQVGFEAWAFPPGVLMYAGDVNQNGQAELFVHDFVIEQNEDDPLRRRRGLTIYERNLTGGWTKTGELRGINPQGFWDLDGDGRMEVVGGEQFVGRLNVNAEGQQTVARGTTIGVRRDDPDGTWRLDERVFAFIEQVAEDAWESPLETANDAHAVDLDGDGRKEILVEWLNRLYEWDGNAFQLVFTPEDPVFGEGGGASNTTGDFDGDGQMEMALGTWGPRFVSEDEIGIEYYHQHARILENRGDDTYVELTRLAYGMDNMIFSAAGDITGDGIDDLVIGGGRAACGRFQLWTTAGDDAFRLLWEYDIANDNGYFQADRMVTFGDVDGDGDQELIACMAKTLTVWDWRPDEVSLAGGTMVQIYGERISRVPMFPVWAADLDGDGADEVMTYDSVGHLDVGLDDVHQNPRGVLVRRLIR